MKTGFYTAAFVCMAQMAMADVTDRLEAAFTGWAQAVGADRAVLTIRDAGQPVRDVALGMPPDAKVETASLSKAITAACAAQMVEDGLWTTAVTSHEVLGYGAKDVSLAQLLTHTSGLGPDQTQSRMFWWLDRDVARMGEVARRALNREPQDGQAGSYQYNNENYAIIGAMIEARTRLPYAEACHARVLAPAGITEVPTSPRTGAFLPWGGWHMTVQEYAAFHWHAYGPDGIIGQDPNRWPRADLGRGAQYGMGMFHRTRADGYNHWHFGALCIPGRLNIGSYAVIWLGGYSVVAAYDICPTWEQMGALDGALVKAVFE